MRTLMRARRQSGFTLVEFMIAGMLGLVILGGVLHIMVNSKQTFILQGGIADVQDSGRFALKFLRDDLQRVGWSLGKQRELDVPKLLAESDSCVDAENRLTSADCLTVAYQGQLDCLGNPNNDPKVLVRNTYQLINVTQQSDGAELGQLSCTSGTSAVTAVLVENVESFQVQYGVDGEDANTLPDFYTATPTVPQREATVALRFGLTVASEPNILDTPRTYSADELTVLDQLGTERTDRRLRRVYITTVSLPNRALHPMES